MNFLLCSFLIALGCNLACSSKICLFEARYDSPKAINSTERPKTTIPAPVNFQRSLILSPVNFETSLSEAGDFTTLSLNLCNSAYNSIAHPATITTMLTNSTKNQTPIQAGDVIDEKMDDIMQYRYLSGCSIVIAGILLSFLGVFMIWKALFSSKYHTKPHNKSVTKTLDTEQ